jgi:hypothetical protein
LVSTILLYFTLLYLLRTEETYIITRDVSMTRSFNYVAMSVNVCGTYCSEREGAYNSQLLTYYWLLARFSLSILCVLRNSKHGSSLEGKVKGSKH